MEEDGAQAQSGTGRRDVLRKLLVLGTAAPLAGVLSGAQAAAAQRPAAGRIRADALRQQAATITDPGAKEALLQAAVSFTATRSPERSTVSIPNRVLTTWWSDLDKAPPRSSRSFILATHSRKSRRSFRDSASCKPIVARSSIRYSIRNRSTCFIRCRRATAPRA